MLVAEEKEIWRNNITKRCYRIKMIKDQMVILEAINGSSQVFTTKENLNLFYTRLNHLESNDFSSIQQERNILDEADPLKKSNH
jgi:hypothetical protein